MKPPHPIFPLNSRNRQVLTERKLETVTLASSESPV